MTEGKCAASDAIATGDRLTLLANLGCDTFSFNVILTSVKGNLLILEDSSSRTFKQLFLNLFARVCL